MKFRIFTFILTALTGMLIIHDGYSQTFFVSPRGNDSNSGSHDQPLASLHEAQSRLRQLKRKDFTEDTARVIVMDGTYLMEEPLIFGPEDGGRENFPVVFRAEKGAKPVFYGGRRVDNIHVDENGYWTAMIPEIKDGLKKFEQLYVNGHRAQRAFAPDSGFFIIRDVKEHVLLQGEGRAPQQAQQVVTADTADIRELQHLPVNELKEVVMTIYHKWDISKRHPEGVGDSLIFTTGKGMKPWNKWKRGQRYKLENYKAALTKPGEWFLDDSGLLTYIPLPGEEPHKAEMIMPYLSHFIIIRGDTAHDNYVSHLRFEGLRFYYSANYLPPGGFEPSQAAATIDAAIQIDGARDITFVNCEIAHTGNYGIWFRASCSDCGVKHCHIYDLGAGGVRIGTMKIPDDTLSITRRITLENNIIQNGGLLFPPAVGVWIGQSSDNTVTHNDIGDFRYTGVSVGWVWGYAYSPAKRNKVTYNHIHHIGWGLLSDMGGVYTLGKSEGTVVSNNVIDHILAWDYGGWGLYPDEGSSHILMENNLVYETKTGGFHQHYGKENIIRNNIFAFASIYQLQCTRVENHLSFSFLNNIVYYNDGVLLGGPWDKIKIEMDSNIFWNTREKVSFLNMDMKKWREETGHDQNSLVTDPGFTNDEHPEFLPANKKALKKTGFIPFDYSKAGVYGSDEWKKTATLPEKTREDFDRIILSLKQVKK